MTAGISQYVICSNPRCATLIRRGKEAYLSKTQHGGKARIVCSYCCDAARKARKQAKKQQETVKNDAYWKRAAEKMQKATNFTQLFADTQQNRKQAK